MNTAALKEVKERDALLEPLASKVLALEQKREEHVAVIATVRGDGAGRFLTVEEQRRVRDAEDAISEIDSGPLVVAPNGYTQRTAGLVALKARLERLRAERDEWYAKSLVDPNEPVRCRLSRPAKHYADGRMLKVGEEIVLTRAQLEAFGDRFEVVKS